jgi:pyruvate/2-oxoglutarate dehydrogenase complex dihydrolipoamide dehydrogenase (E3) component
LGYTECALGRVPDVQVFKRATTIDRFITGGKTTGFLKVVMDGEDNVLGADAIGAHSSEWIRLIAPVMKHEIPADGMFKATSTAQGQSLQGKDRLPAK